MRTVDAAYHGAVTPLRTYYYRDDKQISEFLEQLLDGAVSETAIKHEGQSSKSGRLGLGGFADAGLGSKATSSESFTLASTPVSRAAQLEGWLGDEIAPLGPMDTEAFSQVRRGEFIRFEGVLKVPEVVRMAFVGAAVGQLVGIAEAFGESLDGADAMVTQAEALQRLVRLDGFPIIAQERSGGPAIMFIARPELIVGEPLSLHGEEFTVLGRVKRTIAAGQTLAQSELLPSLTAHLPQQNRQQRRASGTTIQPVALAGPAVLVEPVAIYT